MKFYFSLLILCSGLSQYEAAECSEKSENRPEIYFLHIDSYIRYRYATTTVVSKVVNPLNNSQEVFFGMNLPETAFITSFVMEINGKEYEAYLKGKEEAQEIYNTAVSSGQSAGHVATSSRDSNHFKISVNIEALGKIKFTLTYEELLKRTLGIYKQVINLNPGQTVRDLKVNVFISESSEIKSLFVPEIKVKNEIETDEKENKNVNITRLSSNKAVVRYAPSIEDQEKAGGACFEGQFIVQYDVNRIHPCGQVLVDEGYFVHFYAPEGFNPLRKLAVFVLDISGSMYGRKLEQLKQAMTTILDELRGDDYFSVVGFSSSVTVFNLDSPLGNADLNLDSIVEPSSTLAMQQAYPASKNYVEKAKQVIAHLSANGGTDINDALKTSIILSQKAHEKIKNDLKNKSEEALEPMIIFLTDGEPTVGITNLRAIRSTVRELNVPRTVIYSLGFGLGADIEFLKKLSLENSGFGKKIYEASDAALQLKNFYKLISSPLLSNVTFSYIPSQVANNSLTKKYFRSLFRGSELIVAGKLVDNGEELQMDVYSISSNGTESCAVQGLKVSLDTTEESTGINSSEKKQGFGSLERLWAYLTVKQLLDKKETLDEDNKEEASKLKEAALDLALKYKFVTPLTSLVVVKPNETDAVTELEDPSKNKNLEESLSLMPLHYLRPPGSILLQTPSSSFASFYTRRAPIFSGVPSYAAGAYMLPSLIAPQPIGAALLPRTTTFDSHPIRISAPTHQPHKVSYAQVEDDVNIDLDLLNSSSAPKDINKGNLTLSDLEWLDQVLLNNQTMEVSIPVKNSTQIFTIVTNPDTSTYQSCTNLPGKCTHLVSCILPNFASSLQEFLKYFCPIPGDFVGVCCPLGTNTSSSIFSNVS